jgi:hypothetical protein
MDSSHGEMDEWLKNHRLELEHSRKKLAKMGPILKRLLEKYGISDDHTDSESSKK